MRTLSYVAILLAFGLTAACSASEPSVHAEATSLSVTVLMDDELSVEAVDEGTMGALVEEHREVITDAETFETRWNALHSHRNEPPAPPAVDFDERMVVLAALGQRPTGGYRITLDRAVHDKEEGVVELILREVRPGQGCMVQQVLTFPYLLATVEAVDASYTFVEGEPREADC